MSSFDTMFAAHARGVLMAELGETVTYTPNGSDTGSSITARVDDNAYQVAVDGDDGPETPRAIRVTVSTADVSDPQEGDVLTWDSVDWGLAAVESAQHGEAVLRFVRREKKYVSGPELYRRG